MERGRGVNDISLLGAKVPSFIANRPSFSLFCIYPGHGEPAAAEGGVEVPGLVLDLVDVVALEERLELLVAALALDELVAAAVHARRLAGDA